MDRFPGFFIFIQHKPVMFNLIGFSFFLLTSVSRKLSTSGVAGRVGKTCVSVRAGALGNTFAEDIV